MRKAMVILVVIFFVLSGASYSYAKKENTGKVKDNIFFDKKYDYKITALDNWKVKTQKEPSILRATIMQKDYKRKKYRGFSLSETAVPTITILAGTTSHSLEDFYQSFLKDKEIVENKGDFLIKLNLLENFEVVEEESTSIDNVPAKICLVKKKYSRPIEIDAKPGQGAYLGDVDIIEDFLAGYIILLKKENKIFVIEFSTEREFFYENNSEFTKMLKSMKFGLEEAETKKVKK